MSRTERKNVLGSVDVQRHPFCVVVADVHRSSRESTAGFKPNRTVGFKPNPLLMLIQLKRDENNNCQCRLFPRWALLIGTIKIKVFYQRRKTVAVAYVWPL